MEDFAVITLKGGSSFKRPIKKMFGENMFGLYGHFSDFHFDCKIEFDKTKFAIDKNKTRIFQHNKNKYIDFVLNAI